MVEPAPAPVRPDPGNDDSEPLIPRAVIVAVATAALDLAVKFGLRVDDDTKTLIIGLVSALALAVLTWWGRRHVWSPKSVNALLAQANARNQTIPTPRRPLPEQGRRWPTTPPVGPA